MASRKSKIAALGVTALVLGMGLSHQAKAYPALPGLPNLDFTDYTGKAPKNLFTVVKPVGWTGGTGLISIDAPGTATHSVQTDGNAYGTWVDPGAPPGGGNYIQADGNPHYESGFSYKISGLTPGQTYSLSFYQASGQQTGFSGATTEQWIVSLAKTGALDVCENCGPPSPHGGNASTYSSTDPHASIVATTLMNTPSKGGTPWEYVSVDLTADAATEWLSFLAWGNEGSTVNEPPTVFLTAVNAPPGLVPEPAAMAVFGVGLLGLGGIALRRRTARKA